MSLDATINVRLGTFELDVALGVETGELVGVLGPNGAGKSTLLRCLAGLRRLDQGEVVLDGALVERAPGGPCVPAHRRSIGVVFQDYLLFPHLSALDNVAFGLRARGTPKSTARRRAHEWLERVGVADKAHARPAAMSGGQAQRVALARALATEPKLLLLDEPMAALDVATRAAVRRDLRSHLASFTGTRLLVTHDPLEAMVLSDRLVIIEGGRVVQRGTPAEVSQRPRSRYVAELVGLNLYKGRAVGDAVNVDAATIAVPAAGHGDVFVVVRPQTVALHRSRPEGTPRNVWRGEVEAADLDGDRMRVRVGGELPLVAEVTTAAALELRLPDGGPVWASVKATEVLVYPA